MTTWEPELLEEILVRHAGERGALLPILHDVQAKFGHIPKASVASIADALNLSRAEVHGTISFYHDFRREPPEKPVVKLCRAEACQARGVDRIAPILENDPRVAVETVYCLGLCASGPNAMLGDQPHARLNELKVRKLLERAARG